MRIKYVGQFETVIVPELRREVARGEVVELATEEERAIGERLLLQGPKEWTKVAEPKASRRERAARRGGAAPRPAEAPSEGAAETVG